MMQSKMIRSGLRASAISADKVVRGNATLVSATGINIAAAGIAVWQLLAFVTAQKYLLDINRRLDAIENGIRSIKELMDNERLGKLLGNLKYLHTRASNLFDQDLTESQVTVYVSQFEQIDRECLQIMESLRLQLESETASFAAQPLKGGVFSVEAGDKAPESNKHGNHGPPVPARTIHSRSCPSIAVRSSNQAGFCASKHGRPSSTA